jgi:hypothetical protein
MRRRGHGYECALCGAVLDIPVGSTPRVVMKASSGLPNMRAIVYEGAEVHACPLGERPRRRSAAGSGSIP